MTMHAMEVIKETDIIPYEDSDDPNRRTHIVNAKMNKHVSGWTQDWSGQDVVDMARLTGQEVVALCGYRWVPVHDPEKYDSCKSCFNIFTNGGI